MNILQGQSVLRPSLLQVEILNSVVIPREGDDGGLLSKDYLPFQDESELECVDMVHFRYLDDVNDGNRNVYIHWDVQILLLVKAEGCNLLIIVALKDNKLQGELKYTHFTFIKSSLQLPSSDSSRQLEVWSHLCSIWMHCPSLHVNLPGGQVVSFTCLILQRNI